MTTTEGTLAAIAAVVVFWIVGAYNRLVRLRSELVARSFRFFHDQARIIRHLETHPVLVSAQALACRVIRLLGSESGPFCDASRDLLRSWLARMEDDALPGASHLMHMPDPAGASTWLVGFLNRHPLMPRR